MPPRNEIRHPIKMGRALRQTEHANIPGGITTRVFLSRDVELITLETVSRVYGHERPRIFWKARSQMEPISPFLRYLIGASPWILVCSIGIVVSVRRWSCHRSVSLLTSVGLGLLMLNTMLVALIASLPRYLLEQGWNTAQIGPVIGVVALLANIVGAIALGLVVCAVFIGREKVYWD